MLKVMVIVKVTVMVIIVIDIAIVIETVIVTVTLKNNSSNNTLLLLILMPQYMYSTRAISWSRLICITNHVMRDAHRVNLRYKLFVC